MITSHINSKYTTVVSSTLPILPIIQNYGWNPFDFGFITVVVLAFWGLINGRKIIAGLPKYLNLYLIYYLFAYILGIAFAGSLQIPLGWVKLYLIYGLFFSIINFGQFLRSYTVITYLSISFLYIQFLFGAAGIQISGIATFLPLSFLDESDSATYLSKISTETWRYCSFFSEPALFAQYLMPFYALSLFLRKGKDRIIKCIIVSGALLLLRSGNALLILGIITLCFFIYSIFSSWSAKKFVGLVAVIILLAVGGTYYLQSEDAAELMDRQEELYDDNKETSGFFRIYRGYFVYEELSIFEKIFGANNTTLMDQAIQKSPVAYLFRENDYYFNTVQNILIKTGMVGCLIFIIFLISLYRRTNPAGKLIIITMIAISFVASMYLSNIMLIYLIFAYKLKKSNENSLINYHTCRV